MPAAPVPTPNAALATPVATPRAVWTSRAAAVLAAVIAATLVTVVRRAGWLGGVPGLAAVVALCLAFPTSRLLARRILIAGALAFGAAPVLWLWDLPVGATGRVTVLMALGAGALSAWVLWPGRGGVRARVRRLAPRLQRADLLPGLAAVGAGWATLPWLRVRTGPEALTVLLSGWDNSAHYAMVAMIRRFGVTTDRLTDVPPEHWKFTDYPEGFHAFVAAIMETTGSTTVAAPAQEVIAFVRAEAWVVVIAATLLTAAIVALPWARRRPLAAVPVAAGVIAAFVIGPGGGAIAGGFANFVVAAALAACVPLLVVTMPRVAMPLHLAAVGSLLVAVAQSWVLLLVVAAPAALVLVLPPRRAAWRGTRAAWVLSGAIIVATLLGIVQVATVIATLDPATVLFTAGGFGQAEPGLMAAVCLAAVAMCLLADRGSVTHVTWTALAPATGLAAVTLLGAFQLATDGQLSYYFWKALLGVELVAFVILGLAATRALRRRNLLPHGPGRRRTTVALLACTVAATQVLGFESRRVYTLAPMHTAIAEDLLDAATLADAAPGGRWTFVTPLSPTDGAVHPVLAQQWLLALTGRWTHEANDEAEDLTTMGSEVADLVRAATEALTRSPDAHVLVSPTDVDAVRAGVAPELSSRVVSLS